MATHVQDDYLICREYKEQIHQKSTEYPGFITFKHENGNHYFAWVNNDEIVLRSEAYPDADKMERGIKAILKNCDLTERYSIDEQHGAHFLVLWGGGEEQHTGNRARHSEIGRSCPHKSMQELQDLIRFKGDDFASKVVPFTASAAKVEESHETASSAAPIAAAVAAAAAPVAAAAAHSTTSHSSTDIHSHAAPQMEASASTSHKAEASASHTHGHSDDVDAAGGGMFKWLLPILLLGALGAAAWYLTKDGCGSKKVEVPTIGAKEGAKTVVTAPKAAYDSVNNVMVYDEGAKTTLTLRDGVKLDSVGATSFENQLVEFIKNGKIDTVNKKLNWIDLSGVNFVTNKTDYVGNSAMRIANAGKILKAYPSVEIKIGGHTDKSGDAAKNKVLSQQRADKVKADLITAGATANQIKEAVGYGGEFATAEISDKVGMAKDRKVAVKVSKQ
jgi:outer membrane protein OmpA-like peptidoglycan-associated protein/uncharacterized protein YegP (UPF0339 family)